MRRGGRFGKYGEQKRYERLHQKKKRSPPLKPIKKPSGRKSLMAERSAKGLPLKLPDFD